MYGRYGVQYHGKLSCENMKEHNTVREQEKIQVYIDIYQFPHTHINFDFSN